MHLLEAGSHVVPQWYLWDTRDSDSAPSQEALGVILLPWSQPWNHDPREKPKKVAGGQARRWHTERCNVTLPGDLKGEGSRHEPRVGSECAPLALAWPGAFCKNFQG